MVLRVSEKINIMPQAGPQKVFLASRANIAIFGGGAGGGKSYALLLEVLRHFNNSKFSALVFRRNSTQVRNPGGLWDMSAEMYSSLGAVAKQAFLEWEFPSGASVKFAHLENKETVFNYQGAQVPLICWDELTHFEESQFWYMMSRLRSTSGVPGYMRATCNPDPDSWVRKLVDWWIDDDGYPIKERAGKLRWFIRRDDSFVWADEKTAFTENDMPRSVTFIPSLVHDNKILLSKDPTYVANLKSLSRVDRARLLEGNWNARANAGSLFRREWFPMVEAIPSGWVQAVRFWDRAATKPSEHNPDPDWTRGLLLYKYANNTWIVGDLRSDRDTPGRIENLIRNTAQYDGGRIEIVSQQDPGSAGVAEAEYFVRMLAGYNVRTVLLNHDKVTRAKPVSAQCEAGNISILRAPWNEALFSELENFSDNDKEYAHDDIVDVFSGAFNELTGGRSLADAYSGRM
jgi:predicted phage terminase large subunit-like protein